MVVKSDQEPSIIEVQKEIAEFRRKAGVGGTALENPRVGDSQSNGRVERAIEELGGLIRTHKAGLKSRLGHKILLTHPTVPWMIKHAASIINCYVVRACGKTSFERIKGRRCIEPIAEIGEFVFFRPAKTAKEKMHKDSWRDRFAEGIWLGTNMRTSESIVGTRDGVFRAGAIRRKPPDERWNATYLQELKGCPQQPVPGRDSYRMPNYVRPELVGGEKSDAPPSSGFTPPPFIEQPKVRGLYASRKDFDKHGPTQGCKKCRALFRGVAATMPHSAECHDRFAKLIAEDPAGAAKVARAEERLVRETHRIGEGLLQQADKKRIIENDKEENAEPAAVDSDMQPVAPTPSSSSAGPSNPITKKRQSETALEEIDPRLNDGNTDNAEIVTESQQQPDAMMESSQPPMPPPLDAPVSQDADMNAIHMPTSKLGAHPPKQGPDPFKERRQPLTKEPVEPVTSSPSVSRHSRPEQRSTTTRLPHDELQWRQIGSGSWARTFVNADRLVLTTRGGPCEADIERRIIRDAITGKLIDDCRPADTPDSTLLRQLPLPTTIRVELIMRDAAKWFRQKGADVAELYSPPRVVQEAGLRVYGGRRLRLGWSLDLTVDDPETGKPWDLSDGKIRTKVMHLIAEGKPYMIVLSPMCTAFSQIQAINKGRRDPAVVRRELDEAKDHIRWVMKICAIQARANRYFVFEHPANATSWDMAEVKKVHSMEGVLKIKFDMCQFGMEAKDPTDGVIGPVQKRTAVLTNSYEVAQRLRRDSRTEVQTRVYTTSM